MVFKKKQPKPEGVVVGGKKKLQLPDVKKLKTIDWRSRKAKNLIIIVIIALLLIPVGFYAYGVYIGQKNKQSRANQPGVCESDKQLLSSFVNAMNTKDTTKAREFSSDVSRKQGFSEDINCLYIMTQTSIYISDLSSATKYFEQLNTQYANGGRYADLLQVAGKKPDVLKSEIEILRQQSEYFKSTGYQSGITR
jgi:hypothetical protein